MTLQDLQQLHLLQLYRCQEELLLRGHARGVPLQSSNRDHELLPLLSHSKRAVINWCGNTNMNVLMAFFPVRSKRVSASKAGYFPDVPTGSQNNIVGTCSIVAMVWEGGIN